MFRMKVVWINKIKHCFSAAELGLKASLTHTHTPPVSRRPAGLAAVCCGFLLLLHWSRGFGRHRGKFLAVLQAVTERLRLTAALTHRAEGQTHVEVHFAGHHTYTRHMT